MHNSAKRLLLIVVLLIVALAPAVAKKKKTQKVSSSAKTALVAKLSEADSRRFDYFFLEGKKQALGGHSSAAMDLFRHCLEIKPDAPEALLELGLCHYAMNEDSTGLALTVKAAELEPQNSWYQELLASAYLNKYDLRSTAQTYEKLSVLQPKRTDILERLVQLYKYIDEPQKAISALDRLELIQGKSSDCSMEKYQLYASMGEEEKGLDEIRKLCEDNPHDPTCRLILANLYADDGRMDEAKAIFDEVQRTDPQNGGLQTSLLNYYDKTDQTDLYQHLCDSILYSSTTSSDLKTDVLGMLIEKAGNDSTQLYALQGVFDKILAQPQADASMLKAYLAYQHYSINAPEAEQYKTMWRILEKTPDDFDVTRQLLQQSISDMNLQQIEKLCKTALQYHSDKIELHYFLGISLAQQDKDKEAIAAFETGLHHVEDAEEGDANIISEMYVVLGDLYHEQGREADAFAAYDSCLVYKDDNVSCLNNYAYYLSLKGVRLDEAENMSYRVIRLEPDNKTYLDTYAWVLFVEGDYSTARTYIDRVVDPKASDDTLLNDESISCDLLEHAGDIYAQCGLMPQAEHYWELAVEKGSSSATLVKKLKLKKYIK